ncbi:MAG: Ig-like domain-containing protein [Candidatus Bathyarchaeia archaeon]
MKKLAIIALTVLIVISYLTPYSFSQTARTYQILNHPNGSTHYLLTVTVQQSLYDFYKSQSHQLTSISDFPKFVTPYPVAPIAERLWDIYGDDEDFANGVLMIVHQIPYNESGAKYPVETIVENIGDCDVFSYMAASIMMAGGLDVVLLYYENQFHMNVGVSLSHVPRDARGTVCYVTLNDKRYYIAECTGGSLFDSWRVGECPPDLIPTLNTTKVITLENCDQTKFGQVSASYKPLESSALSLAVSSPFAIEGSTVTISGRLSPSLSGETVTIYLRVGGLQWLVLGTATTNANGEFSYVWTANTTGVCFVRASWFGDNDYGGADSPTIAITVLSPFFFVLLAFTITLTVVGCAIFLISRRTTPAPQEPIPPPPPEVPT